MRIECFLLALALLEPEAAQLALLAALVAQATIALAIERGDARSDVIILLTGLGKVGHDGCESDRSIVKEATQLAIGFISEPRCRFAPRIGFGQPLDLVPHLVRKARLR